MPRFGLNWKVPASSIGPNNLLIAAYARSLDLILVTANTKEFSRVPGASVENWLELPFRLAHFFSLVWGELTNRDTS